jgi:putative restriction endonuclease
MKAVFDTKPNSGYDDEIVRQYHFPASGHYMAAAEAAVGDWSCIGSPSAIRVGAPKSPFSVVASR